MKMLALWSFRAILIFPFDRCWRRAADFVRLTREEEHINLHDFEPVDIPPVKEESDSSVVFTNLLNKAEKMMQNLAVQISHYSSYESKSPKAICIDRGSSPVAVETRSTKVLCKPYGKSVGIMPMAHEHKVNVSIQVTDDLLQVNVVNQGTSFNVLDMEKETSLHEFDNDKSLKLNTENVAVQTENVPVENENVPIENENLPVENENVPVENENVPVENENVPVENENVPVENESMDDMSEEKTKLTVQQMPSINIPRSLVMQKIPDIVITATESLPEADILQDNNIGYIIVKHRSTEETVKPTSKSKYSCGCTDKSNKKVLGTNNANFPNTSASNIPTIPFISIDIPTPTYDKEKESNSSSFVSFNYDKKTFENGTSDEVGKDVEYFNRDFKTDESVSDELSIGVNDEDDVFERTSRLSTYIELGKTDKVLKEYVRDVIKDPKAEILFKSFQLINDKVGIDIEAGSEVDISSVDVNFYKTFVNPNGPKNTDVESSNAGTASTRNKAKQQVKLDENVKPVDREKSNDTHLSVNELQPPITLNNEKPSDSDFSEVLVGLTKNTARNSYDNDKMSLQGGEDSIGLQQIEEDPVLKVRELYQEAVRTSKKSGQFTNSHFIDITIPPEIQERFHSGRSSIRHSHELDVKLIEPFAKSTQEKSAPRMIDINVNNFLNTMPDNVSIYSNTTEDVILEIDSEQLREAQGQNLTTNFFKDNSGGWNDAELTDSDFVITHDVSLQTSLEDISEELATSEPNNIENHSKNLDPYAVLPNYSYTSEHKHISSQLNIAMTQPTGEDSANETVQRKNVKMEIPDNLIQNITSKETSEEESMMTFISQLTGPGLTIDPVLSKHFTPGDTQSFLSKYYTADNAEMKTTETSTQTSHSRVEVPENNTNEGQTQTDIWRAAIINPPVLPDLSKIKKLPRIKKDEKSNHRNGDVKSAQYSANNSEQSDSNPPKGNNEYLQDSSTPSPVYTIHSSLNKAWESTSNSEPLTTSEKSDGEISVKCSASIGEIHNCASKNTPRHLRKYPQDLIVREFEKENMKIMKRKVHNRNWISYYVSRSPSPEILDDTSDSIGLVKKK